MSTSSTFRQPKDLTDNGQSEGSSVKLEIERHSSSTGDTIELQGKPWTEEDVTYERSADGAGVTIAFKTDCDECSNGTDIKRMLGPKAYFTSGNHTAALSIQDDNDSSQPQQYDVNHPYIKFMVSIDGSSPMLLLPQAEGWLDTRAPSTYMRKVKVGDSHMSFYPTETGVNVSVLEKFKKPSRYLRDSTTMVPGQTKELLGKQVFLSAETGTADRSYSLHFIDGLGGPGQTRKPPTELTPKKPFHIHHGIHFTAKEGGIEALDPTLTVPDGSYPTKFIEPGGSTRFVLSDDRMSFAAWLDVDEPSDTNFADSTTSTKRNKTGAF